MAQSLFRRIWSWWRRPSAKWALGTLLFLGFGLGIAFVAGFNSFVASTSTMEFCVSCHEMRDFVYAEYQQSVHYKSASGVRPECSDCHVPKPWAAKMWRKVQATFKELPNHLLGKLDTAEKFEAHRLEMAQSVWAAMKANDSRECRDCHDTAVMALDEQKPRAKAQHEDALKSGETCIDCHKGIAHKKPVVPGEKAPAEEDFNL